LIQPGTVLDGEVVMHRGTAQHKARPVFIVFDVLTLGPNSAVLHLPFEQRLHHLRQASFRTPTANRDMFADANVGNPSLALPLVRKNFVHRTHLVDLLAHVVEEKGMRAYRKPPSHHHLTDGIIFQPNLPYVCGTDVNLLKWKYLDTVTIDVELVPPRHNQDADALCTGVMGAEQTSIDMSRYVLLPSSERYRLEADKHESGARIAEVGFDPETGEWYYLTMRPDKIAPNHISTVLGTLLELSESLTTEELQYRMSVPPGHRDTYRKDLRGMLKQLLEHQKKTQKMSGGSHK
jgi:mRNA guanylyltransferase